MNNLGTQEIKDELDVRYQGEKFSRRNKVRDGLYYTHRTFQSAQRIVVVTCCQEDEEICDVVEVPTIPSSQDLKRESRPWMPNGPLSGFYYSVGPDCVAIYEKYIFDTTGVMSDSQAKDVYIFQITGLESLMESCYEYGDEFHPNTADATSVKRLLDTAGATEKENPNFGGDDGEE